MTRVAVLREIEMLRQQVATLTDQRAHDIVIWERRIDEAEADRDAYRRNATLAVQRESDAVRQQVETLTQERDAMQRRADAAEADWRACEAEVAIFTEALEDLEGLIAKWRDPRYSPVGNIRTCAADVEAALAVTRVEQT